MTTPPDTATVLAGIRKTRDDAAADRLARLLGGARP